MAVLLGEMRWPEVQDYLVFDNRLIIVVGSTEQHDQHLPLDCDVMIPWEIAQRVSDRTGVAITPPVTYGVSPHHMGFPGTMSLRSDTLKAIIIDLLESAYQHGFRRILVLNGHGGNIDTIFGALTELKERYPDLQTQMACWWQIAAVARLSFQLLGSTSDHAGADETSLMLVIKPEVVRNDAWPEASAAIGERLLQAAVDSCVAWLLE